MSKDNIKSKKEFDKFNKTHSKFSNDKKISSNIDKYKKDGSLEDGIEAEDVQDQKDNMYVPNKLSQNKNKKITKENINNYKGFKNIMKKTETDAFSRLFQQVMEQEDMNELDSELLDTDSEFGDDEMGGEGEESEMTPEEILSDLASTVEDLYNKLSDAGYIGGGDEDMDFGDEEGGEEGDEDMDFGDDEDEGNPFEDSVEMQQLDGDYTKSKHKQTPNSSDKVKGTVSSKSGGGKAKADLKYGQKKEGKPEQLAQGDVTKSKFKKSSMNQKVKSNYNGDQLK